MQTCVERGATKTKHNVLLAGGRGVLTRAEDSRALVEVAVLLAALLAALLAVLQAVAVGP